MTRGFERVGIIYDVATQAVQRFVTKKIFIMVRGGGRGGVKGCTGDLMVV